MDITPEQLEVIREALGDAVAYRTDSGEADANDWEDEDRAATGRFTKLARELGVALDY